MRTKTTKPADAGSIDKRHLQVLQGLSPRRQDAVRTYTRALLASERRESGTLAAMAKREFLKEFAQQEPRPISQFDSVLRQIIAAEEARKAGRHLRLVVDNDPRKP